MTSFFKKFIRSFVSSLLFILLIASMKSFNIAFASGIFSFARAIVPSAFSENPERLANKLLTLGISACAFFNNSPTFSETPIP